MPFVEFPSRENGATSLRGFLAEPDSPGPHPALIVCHEIFGLVPHFEDLPRRLAREGYVALCVDMFSREGTPSTDDLDVLRPMVGAIPDSRFVSDLQAGVDFLGTRPTVRADAIAALGFCIGGAWAVLLSGADPRLKASIMFYGRIRYPELSATKLSHPIESAKTLKGPLLGFFAKEDPFIPLSDVEDLKTAVESSGNAQEIHVVDAPHGFLNDTRSCYREDAAKDAWAKTMVFLGRTLKT